MEINDSFGRKWQTSKTELDNHIQKHKLHLEISYDMIDGVTYFHLEVWTHNKRSKLIDLTNRKPLSDNEILNMVRSITRNDKIDKLLDEGLDWK